MSRGAYSVRRVADPAPRPGLGRADFQRICENGFGDGHNSFGHSLAWFQGKLYVGTTRSNFQMVKIQAIFKNLPVDCWPVEGPDDPDGLYRELDRRAQIWCFDPKVGEFREIMRAPMVMGSQGEEVARETGHRRMVVFQGESDPAPALYVATWAVGRSPGPLLLRSEDGESFEPCSPYGILEGLPITATRVLAAFKDRLFTSPTGTRGHGVKFVINVSGNPIIYETRDPRRGKWVASCEPGFGETGNAGVFQLCSWRDQLYAGTINNEGFQLWRSDCEGEPPYQWEKVLERGAARGALNQAVVSMHVFRDALYIGTGIQNGGYDLTNDIGPAGAELLRLNRDDSWDLVMGDSRDADDGSHRVPLSGFSAGFGNLFNGYVWSLQEHDGWLYLGTMDSTIWLRYLRPVAYTEQTRAVVEGVGAERIVENEAGCDLWRSADGENWLPVTKVGFDNVYNFGIRNMVSSSEGLFVATANPFGPRVAVRKGDGWTYQDNDRGGLEIWRGHRPE
ncbi:MAG: hypothetical protein LJE84_12375 [Gammaproteobacteria bacterium]|nr:hypothetical protein [Gammaproteobacteria bacterium]